MSPAVAGWIVLGVLCGAALILMLIGAVQVMRAQRQLKIALKCLEDKQRRVLDPERLNAALTRIVRDAESAKDLMERARGALSTIGVALRYCAAAVRIVKLLA
jgi:hypothetical protein